MNQRAKQDSCFQTAKCFGAARKRLRALLFIYIAITASPCSALPETAVVRPTPPPQVTLFVVTTTADHNDHVCDNDCTLREAIGAADVTAGDCAITFSIPTSDPGYSSGVWTITLDAVLPDLNTDNAPNHLSISGPGADKLTVQRNLAYGAPSDPHFRIFNVTTSGTVNISGMTIKHGKVFSQTDYLGGGIQNYNAGTVNITNCILTDNEAVRW